MNINQNLQTALENATKNNDKVETVFDAIKSELDYLTVTTPEHAAELVVGSQAEQEDITGDFCTDEQYEKLLNEVIDAETWTSEIDGFTATLIRHSRGDEGNDLTDYVYSLEVEQA